jgi:hypothetical protein
LTDKGTNWPLPGQNNQRDHDSEFKILNHIANELKAHRMPAERSTFTRSCRPATHAGIPSGVSSTRSSQTSTPISAKARAPKAALFIVIKTKR